MQALPKHCNVLLLVTDFCNRAAVCAGQGRQAYGSAARVHPLFGQDGAAEGQRPAAACQMVHSSPVLAI